MPAAVKKPAAVLLAVLLLVSYSAAVTVDDARAAVEAAQDALEQAKSEWSALQPINLFDEQKKQEGFEKLKEVWVKLGSVAQKKLELAKARVEANPRIEAGLKSEIISGTDELIADIESWKSDISASQNLVEFLRALSGVKSLWQEFVWKSRRYFGLAVLGNADTIIEKGKEMQTRFADKIEELRAAGKDVGTLESIKANYDADLAEAEAKVDEAREKALAITEWDNSGELFRDGRALFRDAVQAAKDALRDLREARIEIVRLGGEEAAD